MFRCSTSDLAAGNAVRSDEGLTLEMSAKHQIPRAKNIPYQPLLIKTIFSVLAHAEKPGFFFKTSLPVITVASILQVSHYKLGLPVVYRVQYSINYSCEVNQT